MALSFFYDEQIKRYVEQSQRVFSNFKIRIGFDRYGNEQFYSVPCVYGDSSRMSQHLLRQNSENTILPVPCISVYDSDLTPASDRRQAPNHVDKRQVFEREFDKETGAYSEEPGRKYTVERIMPVPYDLTITVDFWYTLTDHKMQICEQILTLFNPDINIQTSVNPVDWTGITTMTLDSMSWNSRGVPVGLEDQMRITSFTFLIPIWINPPAKVKKQKLIHQIVTDIYTTNITGTSPINYSYEGITSTSFDAMLSMFNDNTFAARSVITPNNHYISVDGNEITLLGPDQGTINPDTGDIWDWELLIDQYDDPIIDNISMIRLRPGSDIEEVDFDFIGRIRYHDDKNKLFWSADLETIPVNTLDSIDAIIDPDLSWPANGLPAPANGQRYIIGENEIRENAQGNIWTGIAAELNDIIEFNGAVWSVTFDASEETGIQYTTNEFTGKKLKYDTENGWVSLPDGIWKPGFWRLVLGD